jgi:rRNA maturation protein Nop10
MKRCPSCERTYTEDALSFCPNDGTPLVTDTPSSFDPQATIMATPPKVSGPFDQPSGPTDWPSQPPPAANDWSTPQPPAQQSNWGDTPGSYTPGSYTPGSQMTGGTGWQAPPPPPFPGAAQKQQSLAVASLICGILSPCCFGLLTGIPAVILGFMAINREKSNPELYGGRGMAIAGIILGGVGFLFTILYIILNIIGAISR